ncbi:MAG: Biopolymer transport protein ExbD/TolR [Chthoniobacteraceae bacterium]|nr:Biopolymer transport protein ExbD/TolR [Chthoniobacteraceae bacterium]
MPQVIIVSMIDIFAILLIFVIVTMTFKVPVPEPPPKQPSVSIKLPESSSAVAADQTEKVTIIAVSKTADGEKVYLDDQEVSLLLLTHQLKEILAAKKGGKPAFAMRADESISYGFLIKVLDALKDGGVQGNLSAFTETKK